MQLNAHLSTDHPQFIAPSLFFEFDIRPLDLENSEKNMYDCESQEVQYEHVMKWRNNGLDNEKQRSWELAGNNNEERNERINSDIKVSNPSQKLQSLVNSVVARKDIWPSKNLV